MTALQTEALTADELVTIARKQIDAFNNGEWELARGLFASDAHYHEFGTERTIEGPEQIIELFKGWKAAFPDAAGTVTSSVASVMRYCRKRACASIGATSASSTGARSPRKRFSRREPGTNSDASARRRTASRRSAGSKPATGTPPSSTRPA